MSVGMLVCRGGLCDAVGQHITLSVVTGISYSVCGVCVHACVVCVCMCVCGCMHACIQCCIIHRVAHGSCCTLWKQATNQSFVNVGGRDVMYTAYKS